MPQHELKSSDHVVDFGCGKGRLNFYIYYLFHSYATGIEMNENFYQDSLENQRRFLKKNKDSKNKIQFHHCTAEEYPINPQDNLFYFFNPFTIQIFMVVIKRILLSYEQFQREIELVLYYPSEDYIYFLENHTIFELKREIMLPNVYKNNPNERFLIYKMA